MRSQSPACQSRHPWGLAPGHRHPGACRAIINQSPPSTTSQRWRDQLVHKASMQSNVHSNHAQGWLACVPMHVHPGMSAMLKCIVVKIRNGPECDQAHVTSHGPHPSMSGSCRSMFHLARSSSPSPTLYCSLRFTRPPSLHLVVMLHNTGTQFHSHMPQRWNPGYGTRVSVFDDESA